MENMILKMDSSDEQSAFDELHETIIYSYISYLLFSWAEIRNGTETIFSLKSHLRYCIADKKIISAFCISGVLCSPYQFVV